MSTLRLAALSVLFACSCTVPFSARPASGSSGEAGDPAPGGTSSETAEGGATDGGAAVDAPPLAGRPAGGGGAGGAPPSAGSAGSSSPQAGGGSPSGPASGGTAGTAGTDPASGGTGPLECAFSEQLCDGECFSRLDDERCGSCGNACPDGAHCRQGAASPACMCAGCRDAVGGCVLGVTSGGCATSACEAPCQ